MCREERKIYKHGTSLKLIYNCSKKLLFKYWIEPPAQLYGALISMTYCDGD